MAKDPLSSQTIAVFYKAEGHASCALLMFEVNLSCSSYVSSYVSSHPCSDLNTGNLKSLNDLAQQAKANHIVHTGDFGFYDEDSLQRIADKYAS